MLRFLLWLLPSLLIGFWCGRRRPNLSARLAIPVVHFGVPISVMGLLLRGGLGGQMVLAAALAVLAIALMLLLAHRLPGLHGLSARSMRLGSCIGNTAYVGVPLALAFLPTEALAISIGYDLGATLLTWSLGPVFIGGARLDRSTVWSGWLLSLSSSPATRGLLGALLVQWTPWRFAVAEALWWPSRGVIVVALMVVGMRLGSLSGEVVSWSPLRLGLMPPMLVKLLLYPGLLLLLGIGLRLDPVMIQAIALQGAAPTAISLLLIAESVGVDQERAAGLVFWSTVLSLITAPAWGMALSLLMPIGG